MWLRLVSKFLKTAVLQSLRSPATIGSVTPLEALRATVNIIAPFF